MAFGGLEQHGKSGGTLAEINMVPLIDVMLVLLVIFMITAPLLTHAVKIDLPTADSPAVQPGETPPVHLSIDETGQLFWNGDTVERPQLRERLQQHAQTTATAEVHIRAAADAPYRFVARALADAAAAGVSRIGFVTEPEYADD